MDTSPHKTIRAPAASDGKTINANQELRRAPGTQVTPFSQPTIQGNILVSLPTHTCLWDPLHKYQPTDQRASRLHYHATNPAEDSLVLRIPSSPNASFQNASRKPVSLILSPCGLSEVLLRRTRDKQSWAKIKDQICTQGIDQISGNYVIRPRAQQQLTKAV